MSQFPTFIKIVTRLYILYIVRKVLERSFSIVKEQRIGLDRPVCGLLTMNNKYSSTISQKYAITYIKFLWKIFIVNIFMIQLLRTQHDPLDGFYLFPFSLAPLACKDVIVDDRSVFCHPQKPRTETRICHLCKRGKKWNPKKKKPAKFQKRKSREKIESEMKISCHLYKVLQPRAQVLSPFLTSIIFLLFFPPTLSYIFEKCWNKYFHIIIGINSLYIFTTFLLTSTYTNI